MFSHSNIQICTCLQAFAVSVSFYKTFSIISYISLHNLRNTNGDWPADYKRKKRRDNTLHCPCLHHLVTPPKKGRHSNVLNVESTPYSQTHCQKHSRFKRNSSKMLQDKPLKRQFQKKTIGEHLESSKNKCKSDHINLCTKIWPNITKYNDENLYLKPKNPQRRQNRSYIFWY